MEDGKMTIPYIVYEGEQARNERTVKRLVTALIVAVVTIFISNAMWLYSWMQYDYVYEDTVTVDSDGMGIANYIGNNGSIVNGKDSGIEPESEDAQK